MTPAERLEWLERRGRAIRLFVDRVAQRGGRAETEEEDLAILRLEYAAARASLRRAA